MILSIVCICGANYDVDFEPVDGKVPAPVYCPSCGADSTAIVTRKLRQALAESEPAPPLAAPAEERPAAPTHCARHSRAAVEIFCFVCKKPMCKECLRQYGFVCSPYCRRRGEELGLDIPVYENQKSVVADRQRRRLNQITGAMGVLAILLIVALIWYVSIGSRPHVEFKLSLAETEEPFFARFIAPRQALLVTHWRASLYDAASAKQIWTVPFPNPTTTDVQLTDHEIWIRTGKSIMRLDRNTGHQNTPCTIPGEIVSFSASATSLSVVSSLGSDEILLTQITLSSGATTTNTVHLPPASQSAPIPAEPPASDNVPEPLLVARRDEFISTGPNIVHLTIQLEKPNIVSRTTMKKENSRGVSSELRVTETKAFAEEILNDMQRQRTGGIRKVDESTYTVTLQRALGQPASDWTGDITGRPGYYPLASVDILLAGQRMIVFNKANSPIWEATLAYEADPRIADGQNHTGPCVEHGDALYVFDEGVLAAYDLRTGAVRWRLPSVGISHLTFDNSGMLYVSTTSAGLEAIQYADQLNFSDKIVPVILKIEAATGKTLWRVERLGDACYTSGRFLYFTRSENSSLGMLTSSGAAGPDAEHFRVMRVNPRNGESAWEYYQPGVPLAIDFQDNRILLLHDRELQVLKFLSL